jgi:hypothetical protein
VYVHVLQFASSSELSWAMARLLDSAWVEDCLAEPEALRLRFRAPSTIASDILERIYCRGGLTWVSRHTVGTD